MPVKRAGRNKKTKGMEGDEGAACRSKQGRGPCGRGKWQRNCSEADWFTVWPLQSAITRVSALSCLSVSGSVLFSLLPGLGTSYVRRNVVEMFGVILVPWRARLRRSSHGRCWYSTVRTVVLHSFRSAVDLARRLRYSVTIALCLHQTFVLARLQVLLSRLIRRRHPVSHPTKSGRRDYPRPPARCALRGWECVAAVPGQQCLQETSLCPNVKCTCPRWYLSSPMNVQQRVDSRRFMPAFTIA